MKLCKLKLKNLNSFRGEIELDFEKSPLDDASLVAITGPTGAGKTTLLDAICVALYGKTPRLSGTGTQNPSHLISHGETEGHAEVHFLARGTRYLAEWSLRRGASPKGQLRSAANNELISDRLSSLGKSLGSSANTISEEISAILGLDFDAFKRSVMLAQGEFAAFLKAKDEERRTILEATAGVDIYDRLKDALNQKVRELEDTHQEVLQRLNNIPEVTPEQLTESENHLRDLQQTADALDTRRQEVQAEKQRETERVTWFSDLHSAKDRDEELSNQRAEITILEAELEQADRANRLRPERQAFDTSSSELSLAESALRHAETELIEAQRQYDENRTGFDTADATYRTALIQYNQQANDHNAARLDVRQATDRFTRAAELEEDLLESTTRVEGFSTDLTEANEKYAILEAEVSTIEIFLTDNQLPEDRQERLTSANAILGGHRIKHQQLAERLEAKAASESRVSNLSGALAEISGEREEIIARKETAAVSLADANTRLAALHERGTLEEWRIRRQRAAQAVSIAPRYETIQDQLVHAENSLQESQDHAAELTNQHERVTSELAFQSQACQDADQAVMRSEAARESALLAHPINHLRRHLRAGESCPVCGATEHPYVDNVEPEDTERLEAAENALTNAREVAGRIHDRRETLEHEQVRINQDISNVTVQVEAFREEIYQLRSESQSTKLQWRGIYPNAEVSSDWINQEIRDTETAIEDLENAHDSHTQASHLFQAISQELDNSEEGFAREISLLDDAEQSLQAGTEAVEDLKVEITEIEGSFWELLPEGFHGIGPEDAVNQFADRIAAVATRERERDEIQNEVTQLNSEIRLKQGSLETEQDRYDRLSTEIEGYRNAGNRLLDAAREKTGGPTTLNEIDTAIAVLEEALNAKSTKRDDTEQLRQESQTVLTEARANHSHWLSRHSECSQKFEAARDNYLEKLRVVGFDSLETHDSAFRDEVWREQTEERIAAHTEEKQRLAVEIAKLEAIFEENPFEPERLEALQSSEQETNSELEEKQQEIGAQRLLINHLQDSLDRRSAIDAEMQQSGHELTRWKGLQDTIPANSLRDFALDIMFKQMGSLANSQLEYLTSERYQLKVEGIGKLTVVDRWNANEERPVETLSGGESFLTSLALALALSELSRGRAQINSLFLDEGFGTLDSETLDVAIASLEGLQLQGRSIFLISHVGELTRRIPVRIAVERRGDGSSRVQVRG